MDRKDSMADEGTSMLQESNAASVQKTLDVHHYTERLFRFRLSRPEHFRFRAGEFVMIGLPDERGKPILRAYSICSAPWDETLEFFSIKVPNGPLTARLQSIHPGDPVLLGRKPTGTLVLDALRPARRLYLLATGTGFAPFASILREPETYEKFSQVVVFHGTRDINELTYSRETVGQLRRHELLGDLVKGRIGYFGSTTRQPSERMGRITHLIEGGEFFSELNLPRFDRQEDRVMICGSNEMIRDTKVLLEEFGFEEGSRTRPGDFVYEKAFVG
jgi:ferredoxin--NADP+ reductase